ncbi:MAG: methyltransferase domain-containing protein [Pseudorhodoplanes sp.]
MLDRTPGDLLNRFDNRDILARAFRELGVTNDREWAWANYENVVRGLARILHAHNLLEVGGGRDPLFKAGELKSLGIEMTVNDISQTELDVLPASYHKACFDVAGDISAVAQLRGSFDLAFSRMVFEHVADGQRAWSNLYQLLAPGGVALAFIPTLYAFPFVVNKLLPDDVAAKIVKLLYPNRTDDEDPVFPARYSWTYASESKMRPMLEAIGYREVVILPFYGHGYFERFPVVREIHAQFTALARKHDWRTVASYAYIAARK